MILVVLGTGPFPFERLVKAVDQLAEGPQWEFFVQTGGTTFRPVHAPSSVLLSREELETKLRACQLLITHGGVGCIQQGLEAGKPVVAVPRRPELGECLHPQEDLVRALEQEGRILAVYDMAELEDMIARAPSFKASPRSPNRIPELIRAFLAQP